MGFLRRHLSYANVASTLALVLAMSGGALAATHYLINSSKQINPKVLRELKGNVGARGRRGATGLQGATGATGPQGSQGNQGVQGNQGIQGNQGLPGTTGDTGAEGPRGPEGPSGREGPPGPEGGGVGAWTAVTLGAKVKQVSGFEEAAVRTEDGGSSARLRGVLEVTSEIKAGETVLTVPSAFWPKSKLDFGIGVSTASGANHVGSLIMSTTGVVIDPETPVPPGVYYLLDGITWNLN